MFVGGINSVIAPIRSLKILRTFLPLTYITLINTYVVFKVLNVHERIVFFCIPQIFLCSRTSLGLCPQTNISTGSVFLRCDFSVS